MHCLNDNTYLKLPSMALDLVLRLCVTCYLRSAPMRTARPQVRLDVQTVTLDMLPLFSHSMSVLVSSAHGAHALGARVLSCMATCKSGVPDRSRSGTESPAIQAEWNTLQAHVQQELICLADSDAS